MTGDPDELDFVSELVLQCLDRIEREGPAALEAFLDEHSEHAAEVRRRVAPLAAAGLLDSGDGAAGGASLTGDDRSDVPERLGEYRLLDPLGRGGMGLVYRARQESLGREVALKLIRPDQLAFPEARARFRREVEVIARLQHPGIVPVYAFGEEHGTPYFAMERVHGATLGELLQELFGRDPATLTGDDLAGALRAALDRAGGSALEVTAAPLFDLPWDQASARILVDVATALEHAHASGVLHRDLKPSNVMLTVDGRALLFDFGLSRSDAVDRMTRSGSLLGSLPYMAPEQVAGRSADRRTDVYGLGVTLYELLGLRPAFGDEGPLGLRDRILRSEPPAIRARNPSVSRDIALVCEKAMDRDPERRYATAKEFAEDLKNALALRPIRARPAGPALRVRRWWQRNPARAVALVLTLLLVVGGPLAFAVERGRANSLLRLEVLRAEQNLEEAVQAIVDLAVHVGNDELDGLPGIDPVRLEILTEARDRLERIAPQLADDTDRLRDHARLFASIARLHRGLGQNEEARAAFERSIRLFEAMQGRPDVRRLDLDLGAAYVEASLVYERLGLTDEGLAAVEQGVRHLRAAETLEPGERYVSRQLALALLRMGNTLGIRFGLERSRPVLEEALFRMEDDARAAPGLETLDNLAGVLLEIASQEFALGDAEVAQAAADRARRILEPLIAADPADERTRKTLLRLLVAMSRPRPGHPDHARIEAHCRRALELQAELAARTPGDPTFRLERISTLQNLASSLALQDRLDEAFETIASAVVEARTEVELGVGSEARGLLARGLRIQAVLLRETERWDEAVAPAAESLELYAALHRADPGNALTGMQYGTQVLLSAKLEVELGKQPDRDALLAVIEGPLAEHYQGYYLLATIGGMLAERAEREGDHDRADACRALAILDLRSALEAGYQLGDFADEESDLAPLRKHPAWADVAASR